MTKANNFLVVAFTDNNGNQIFDKGDTLIAGINDKDKSGTVTVGDTVTFGSYPLHIDGTGSGSFKDHHETITAVDARNNSTEVHVTTAEGGINYGNHPGSDNAFITEDPNPNNGLDVVLRDSQFSGGPESVFVGTALAGPGAPDTTADDSGLQPGNQGFFDVFIA
jgi:hypothetical protein